MKKRALYTLLALALALVVTLPMALPVGAGPAFITVTKDVYQPPDIEIYYVGDTIEYELSVRNPSDNLYTNEVTRIWDTLPDDTIVEFLGPGETLVQAPGDEEHFRLPDPDAGIAAYIVGEDDIDWYPIPFGHANYPGYYAVVNKFEAEGWDSRPDRVYAFVEFHSRVIRPDTEVTISASAATVGPGDSVTLTITEKNTGHDPLTNVYVQVWQGAELLATLDHTHPSWSCDGNGDEVLDPADWAQSGDPAETWTWTIESDPMTEDTEFVVYGFGTDPAGKVISYPEYPDERDSVAVTVIGPGTDVTITASQTTVLSGESVDLTITEENTGDVELIQVYVEVYRDGVLFAMLDETTAGWSSDINMDDVLDVDETWSWTIDSGPITTTTTFVALGFGTDPLGNVISYPDYPDERDQVTITTDPSVGGQGDVGNKAAILARWIALAGLVVGGVAMLRRRSAEIG